MDTDWLEEFNTKFKGNDMIRRLRELRFHGKLEINFCSGRPSTAHLNWCVRPYVDGEYGKTKAITE